MIRMKALTTAIIALILSLTVLRAVDTPVQLIEGDQAPFPQELIQQGDSGEARIKATIDKNGKVSHAEIESATHPAFGKSALGSVLSWRFKPATQDGQPVAQTVVIPIIFKVTFEDKVNAVAGRQVFVDMGELTDKIHTWGDVKRYFTLRKKEDRVIPYPPYLKGSGVEEEIVVQFVLSPDGLVLNPTLVDLEHKELAVAALFHAATLKFERPKLNGEPIYLQQKVKLRCSEKPPSL